MEQREVRRDTAVLDRPRAPGARPPALTPSPDQQRKNQGVRDIVGGIVLIGIGFLFGGSIFMGDPTLLDWIFDGLGIFWISKGIYQLATAKSNAPV